MVKYFLKYQLGPSLNSAGLEICVIVCDARVTTEEKGFRFQRSKKFVGSHFVVDQKHIKLNTKYIELNTKYYSSMVGPLFVMHPTTPHIT